MKIVDIAEFYSERGGGIRSHLTTRGHVLCQLGHDHVVIAPGPRDEMTTTHAITALDHSQRPPGGRARIVRMAGPALPYDRTYHLLGRFDKIRSFVRSERPDILEAHSPYLATAAVVACGKRSAVVRTAFWHADHLGTHVHPRLARVVGSRAADRVVSAARRGLRVLLAPFDATFVAGRGQARALQKAGVRNVVLARFGVDLGVFRPRARQEARGRELFGHSGGPLLVGVGRLSTEKRWEVVLDAFSRIRGPSGIFVLFGDGPERERLRGGAPPGVVFAGFESDRGRLASALASADALVHGCPTETSGLAVAEAVASGLPVVVPEEGGAAEWAYPGSSETYRGGDAAACAAAVERLLGRRGADLDAHAADAAARVPSVEQHVGQVVSAYEALMREH